MQVKKRDGRIVDFDASKIYNAITSAFISTWKVEVDNALKQRIADCALTAMNAIEELGAEEPINVETLQDIVENAIMTEGYHDVARAYIIYRYEHKQARFIQERIDYMNDYANNVDNAATSSETDPNANVTQKNAANLEGEVYKTTNRIIQRQRMKNQLAVMYPELAEQYAKDLDSHVCYCHDEASTPVLKQYCMAVSLYPLMLEGVGNMDGVTPSAPKHIQAFSGQLVNLAFLLSSQCKGAVAFGEYFIALNYYIVNDFGTDWYDRLEEVTTASICTKQKTVRGEIEDAFDQFVWGVNQPASNRGFQSPFVNISYYDKTYFDSMFGAFYYPDGTQPEWHAVDVLQRMFMKWFNKLRLTQVLTFPVESFAMVHNGTDIIDKEYKDLCAEMYAEGHSFFTYISDSADSLASCCFTKDTKVLWKSSTMGVKLTTLEELHNTKYEPYKKNLRIFHNGFWVCGKSIKLPNRPMYKVVTVNNKELYMTDNHINVTLNGEKTTSQLTTDDYLMFNTTPMFNSPDTDEGLTYEEGLLIGVFLGAGIFDNSNGKVIHTTRLSLSQYNWEHYLPDIKTAVQLIDDNASAGVDAHNPVYPVMIRSKKVVAFIQRWTLWERGTYAYNKKLNLDCLVQSYQFRQGILHGWHLTYWGISSNRCYTASPLLAECMEVLIASLGFQSVIDVTDRTDEKFLWENEVYNRNYPLYCVRWYTDNCRRVTKDVCIRKNNSIYFKIKSIEPYEYNDDVYCIEMKDASEPYFTLPNGIITHNCRLRNQVNTNTFSPTSGLTGVMTGSCNVISLNINRITQDYCRTYDYDKEGFDKTGFAEYLTAILERVYKYHIAYKTMLYDMEDKKMFASSNGGYIFISKLYSTIGINGLNEAARFLGLSVSNNDDYFAFLQLVLGTIKEQNAIHSIQDKKRPFLFNSEVVPAEGLGGKNYRWDKADGYVVPEDENLYNSYFYNAHDDTSVLDKFVLHGRKTYQYTDGGSALHCNLDNHLTKVQYLKLIDFAIQEGTSYFTFNIPNTKCNDCGHIVKQPIQKCPCCGSENLTAYTRIIGYLRPVSAFGSDRQVEAEKRTYSKSETAC